MNKRGKSGIKLISNSKMYPCCHYCHLQVLKFVICFLLIHIASCKILILHFVPWSSILFIHTWNQIISINELVIQILIWIFWLQNTITMSKPFICHENLFKLSLWTFEYIIYIDTSCQLSIIYNISQSVNPISQQYNPSQWIDLNEDVFCVLILLQFTK